MNIFNIIQTWISSIFTPKTIVEKPKFTPNSEVLDSLIQERKSIKPIQITYQPKKIDPKSLEKLKQKLIEITYETYKHLSIEETRANLLEIRKKEQELIKRIENEILSFSLIEIHKKREEERKERERIEREKQLKEKYLECIELAKQYTERNDFPLAIKKLEEAKAVLPKKMHEVKKLEQIFRKKEQDFNNRKQRFEELLEFVQAQQKKRTVSAYNKAILLLEEAKELDIDNYLCDSRISQFKKEIRRLEKIEAERKRKETEECKRKEKYKDDAENIISYFKKNEINNFYHYTDSRNVNSILQNGGLYSLNELKKRNIHYKKGSDTGEMPDYVRLSYTEKHPLLWVSKQKGRIEKEKILNIKIDVAGLKYTKFTNVNAARTATPPTVKFGTDLKFIKNYVKIDIVKQQNSPKKGDPNHPYYQAEIMVKDKVALEYIINLK